MSISHCIEVGGRIIRIAGAQNDSSLIAFAAQFPDCADANSAQLELSRHQDGLHLSWSDAPSLPLDQRSSRLISKPLDLHINTNKLVQQQRSYPAPKQGAFNQALGKKSRRIIDATGGWGADALLMCSQGYQVTIIERNPLMALMISDAMQRLSNTDWAIDNAVHVPEVVCENAITALKDESLQGDCVYLDPMFPPKRKKSAAVNKQMKFLHWLVGEDADASELVQATLVSFKRLAVKRPDYAEPLFRKPNEQFSSKLVHYDVYFA